MIYLNVPGLSFNYVDVKYFSLDDILSFNDYMEEGSYSSNWLAVMELDISTEPGLTNFIDACRRCVPLSLRGPVHTPSWPLPIWGTGQTQDREIFREIFFGRIWPTYAAMAMGAISDDGKTEREQANAVYLDFWKNRLMPLLRNTWAKYSSLVKLYKAKEGNLLDRVKGASASRANFNDTPQEETPSDVWDDPTHETTLTKTKGETETDFATPMERLDEVRRKLEDIYSAWLFEFDKIFIREPNL